MICANGRPLDVIAETLAVWVTAGVAAPLPGYVCVVSKQHVVEPFELDPQSSAGFWLDCMGTARAVRDALSARKINYEIHGNTIRHLHMHLYPRYAGDPFDGKPIDGASRLFHRSDEELGTLRSAVTAAL